MNARKRLVEASEAGAHSEYRSLAPGVVRTHRHAGPDTPRLGRTTHLAGREVEEGEALHPIGAEAREPVTILQAVEDLGAPRKVHMLTVTEKVRTDVAPAGGQDALAVVQVHDVHVSRTVCRTDWRAHRWSARTPGVSRHSAQEVARPGVGNLN